MRTNSTTFTLMRIMICGVLMAIWSGPVAADHDYDCDEKVRLELVKLEQKHFRKTDKLEHKLHEELEKAERKFRKEADKADSRSKFREKRAEYRKKVDETWAEYDKKVFEENQKLEEKRREIIAKERKDCR